jgi:hypothetical protein
MTDQTSQWFIDFYDNFLKRTASSAPTALNVEWIKEWKEA